MLNAEELVSKALESVEAEAQRGRRIITGLLPHAEAAERALRGAGVEPDHFHIGHGAGMVQGVLIHLRIDQFLDAAPVLKALEEEGYRMDGHEDYLELRRRTYRLLGREGATTELPIRHPIKVMCFPRDGAQCRVVKVPKMGHELKFVCDDVEAQILGAVEDY